MSIINDNFLLYFGNKPNRAKPYIFFYFLYLCRIFLELQIMGKFPENGWFTSTRYTFYYDQLDQGRNPL